VGRHSAPDDDSADSVETAQTPAAVAVVTPTRGRHSRADSEDQPALDDTVKIARVEAPLDTSTAVVDRPVAAGTAAEQTKARSRGRSTAADVALVRQHADVRARVLAALLVPFAVYTAAMAAIGKLDRSYLLWIWIPLITAGVLVGLFLDLGHRKYRT
jgi:hypothetical protein